MRSWPKYLTREHSHLSVPSEVIAEVANVFGVAIAHQIDECRVRVKLTVVLAVVLCSIDVPDLTIDADLCHQAIPVFVHVFDLSDERHDGRVLEKQEAGLRTKVFISLLIRKVTYQFAEFSELHIGPDWDAMVKKTLVNAIQYP